MAPVSVDSILALAACASALIALRIVRRLQKLKKREWSRPWLQRREKRSVYSHLLREFNLEDQASFREFHRMNKEQFAKFQTFPLVSIYLRDGQVWITLCSIVLGVSEPFEQIPFRAEDHSSEYFFRQSK